MKSLEESAADLEARLVQLGKQRVELVTLCHWGEGGNGAMWMLRRVVRELESVRAKLRLLAN